MVDFSSVRDQRDVEDLVEFLSDHPEGFRVGYQADQGRYRVYVEALDESESIWFNVTIKG